MVLARAGNHLAVYDTGIAGRGIGLSPAQEPTCSAGNPIVAQTQILVAVVGAAMMMVVADSIARAFGIIAAASVVRFRTNIRDPKEITVLVICLSVGLATGVGRLEISVTLTLFVLMTLCSIQS